VGLEKRGVLGLIMANSTEGKSTKDVKKVEDKEKKSVLPQDAGGEVEFLKN